MPSEISGEIAAHCEARDADLSKLWVKEELLWSVVELAAASGVAVPLAQRLSAPNFNGRAPVAPVGTLRWREGNVPAARLVAEAEAVYVSLGHFRARR